ncbi:uncharacterized protein LOC131595184 [Vicia villosa]|uniref:uncharacterized protein LOC131595184 n=1 Tax=Vicia villosa TaxID=3911 RepID=UPI00273B92F0|nr:uncharacterized protein LOC131595184 [Vicia villosa]XP_058723456.1 uncharacterized protein LOC131595184 [Vicia villosa]
MLKTHRHKPLLYLKALTFTLSPKNPLPFSLHFCTNTSNSTSFAVSYLIHNLGFSPQFASKLSSTYHLYFNTSQNPDLVLNFFKNHGFSHSQLCHIITKLPCLLSCNPSKRVLPKFRFLLSKGASNSDIVNLVSKGPVILSPSLENHIVPVYELLYRFLQSDKDTIACAVQNPTILSDHRVPQNIQMLIENGLIDLNIARLLRMHSKILSTSGILKVVEEVKDLGFDPSRSLFAVAMLAKRTVSETKWKEKVDTFKRWGWSDEDVVEAFRKHPHCMLTSIDKINLVMSFWVDELGWDAMAIAKLPRVLGASLERKIIPRAYVVQYLLKKGLHKKASLTTPLVVSDKLFLNRYIKHYKEESSSLLKLYEQKLNLAHATDKINMS